MTDVVDAENSVQPVVTITTNSGKDVTFDGLFSYYTAILNVLFNGAAGNVYLGENGQLDVAELYIKNALNVGADGSPLKVNLFVTGDDENNLKTPKLTVDAAGNVYIDGTLVRYAEVEGKDVTGAKKLADAKAAQITSVSKGIFDSVKGKNIKLTLNRPQLIVGVLVKDILDSTYTYEKTTAVETALDVVVKSERSEADAGLCMKKKYSTKIPADGKPDIIQMHNALQSILYHLESTLRSATIQKALDIILLQKMKMAARGMKSWIQVLFIVQMKMETVPVKWK